MDNSLSFLLPRFGREGRFGGNYIASRRAGQGRVCPLAAGSLIPPSGISPGDKPLSSEYG